MRIVELIIDEKDDTSGIEAVSVVENPAIESDFIALKKHEIELKEVDAEKRILMGAALIPNKQIYRKNDKNEEYYIYFSEATVRKASELFFILNALVLYNFLYNFYLTLIYYFVFLRVLPHV